MPRQPSKRAKLAVLNASPEHAPAALITVIPFRANVLVLIPLSFIVFPVVVPVFPVLFFIPGFGPQPLREGGGRGGRVVGGRRKRLGWGLPLPPLLHHLASFAHSL